MRKQNVAVTEISEIQEIFCFTFDLNSFKNKKPNLCKICFLTKFYFFEILLLGFLIRIKKVSYLGAASKLFKNVSVMNVFSIILSKLFYIDIIFYFPALLINKRVSNFADSRVNLMTYVLNLFSFRTFSSRNTAHTCQRVNIQTRTLSSSHWRFVWFVWK